MPHLRFQREDFSKKIFYSFVHLTWKILQVQCEVVTLSSPIFLDAVDNSLSATVPLGWSLCSPWFDGDHISLFCCPFFRPRESVSAAVVAAPRFAESSFCSDCACCCSYCFPIASSSWKSPKDEFGSFPLFIDSLSLRSSGSINECASVVE